MRSIYYGFILFFGLFNRGLYASVDLDDFAALVPLNIPLDQEQLNAVVDNYVAAIEAGDSSMINQWLHLPHNLAVALNKKMAHERPITRAIDAFMQDIFFVSEAERKEASALYAGWQKLKDEVKLRVQDKAGTVILTALQAGTGALPPAEASELVNSVSRVAYSMMYPRTIRLVQYEETIAALISLGLALPDELYNEGTKETVLMRAADLGWTGLVHILLKYKAQKNKKNSSGQTPLMYGVKHNNPELIHALLYSGNQHNNPLIVLTSEKKVPTSPSIDRTKKQNTWGASLYYVLFGHGAESSEQVSERTSSSRLPAQSTVNDPAGVLLKDKFGKTAFEYACTAKRWSVVEQLLEYCGKYNLKLSQEIKQAVIAALTTETGVIESRMASAGEHHQQSNAATGTSALVGDAEQVSKTLIEKLLANNLLQESNN